MNIVIKKKKVELLEKGILKSVLLPEKEYKKGVKMHFTTGLFKNYNKVGVKVCKSIKSVFITPRHSAKSTLVEIDYLTITEREKKQLAVDCGFNSFEELLKENPNKSKYSLLKF